MRSRGRHGLQAPFIYQLYEKVFYKNRSESCFSKIEMIRLQMSRNQDLIQVRDFGAGFGGKLYKERTVSYITRNSSKPRRYARLLFRLVQHLRPKVMLELGTSVGISALYQSSAIPESKLITIEGCPQTAALARDNFRLFPELDIELLEGDFESVLPGLLASNPKVDYLFIDGHHKREATLKYIDLCFPALSEHAVIVVDDINWSDEMRELWRELVNDTRFTLTLDVFMLGILFVSRDLSKEHFELRY